MQKGKLNGLLWILVCYAFALAGAWLLVMNSAIQNVILRTFLADVAATAIVFAFSSIFRNASFYDAYWSVAPVPIAIYWKYYFTGTEWTPLQLIVLAVILFWSIRLTLNWYRGWEGLHHEDWRYTDLRAKTGRFYPAVNFLGIHLFPTVMVYLGCLPLLAVFTSFELNNALFLPAMLFFVPGALLGLAAPIIQFFADEQMRAHRKNPQRGYINAGLWQYSRHPNYFGEILFWFAICMMGIAFSGFQWWMAAGIVAMTLMFVFISVPLMEKRMLAKYPDYKEQQNIVSMLIPWKRKK